MCLVSGTALGGLLNLMPFSPVTTRFSLTSFGLIKIIKSNTITYFTLPKCVTYMFTYLLLPNLAVIVFSSCEGLRLQLAPPLYLSSFSHSRNLKKGLAVIVINTHAKKRQHGNRSHHPPWITTTTLPPLEMKRCLVRGHHRYLVDVM